MTQALCRYALTTLLLGAAIVLAGCSGEPGDVKAGSAADAAKRALTSVDQIDKEIAEGAVKPQALHALSQTLDMLRGRLVTEKADQAAIDQIDGFVKALNAAAQGARPSTTERTVTEDGIPMPAERVVDPADLGELPAEVRTFLKNIK